MLYERPLKRVQLVAMSEALDGADLSPIGPHRQIAARIDGLTVQQHRAGSAFAAITADLGAGQAEMVAQQFGKRPTIFHLKAMLSAIHHQPDGRARHPRRRAIRRRWDGSGKLRTELRRSGRRDEHGATAFEKLPAGDTALAFAHDTFPER